MKQRYWLLVAFWMLAAMAVQAQTYEKLWKEVEQMEKKDLPKSALKIAEDIYRKAVKEKNAPEAIKAYWQAMQYRRAVTPDSLYTDIEALERWAQETKEPLEAAVLNSMLGDIYGVFLSVYAFDPPASIVADSLPDDMKEWGQDVYARKSYEHFMRSLKEVDLLGKTSAEVFKPIVIKGDASRYFQHDMLHLLGMAAIHSLSGHSVYADAVYKQTGRIDNIPFWSTEAFLQMQIPEASAYDYIAGALRIYQTMLRYYTNRSMKDAIVLTDLERVDFIEDNLVVFVEEAPLASSPYFRQLQAMRQRYASQEVCAEIYLQMAEFARTKSDQVEALRLVREGIRNYPRYDRINALKNVETQILEPVLNCEVPFTAYPGGALAIRMLYCNQPSVSLSFYQVNLPFNSQQLSVQKVKEKGLPASYIKKISTQERMLSPTPDYRRRDTTLSVSVPGEAGVYLLELKSDRKGVAPIYSILYVSRFKTVCLGLPDDKAEVTVVDAQSGHPVPRAEVVFYKENDGQYNPLWTFQTNEEGSVVVDKKIRQLCIQARKGTDTNMLPQQISVYFYGVSNDPKPEMHVNLFTDRGIYRPGQTVYFSGIVYRQKGDSTHVLADKTYTVELLDVNRKKINEQSARTNSFGSFSGEFVLPSPCLSGRYTVKIRETEAGYTDTYIQVEEYKRPTFEVTLNPVQGAYEAGDSVWVTGKAETFSGVPLQNVPVKYTVLRAPELLWRWSSRPSRIAFGEVDTDDEGKFRFKVYLEADDSKYNSSIWFNSFTIEASVTDVAGETQNGNLRLAVGSSSLVLSSDLPNNVVKERFDKLVFSAKNLDNQPVTVTGEYTVCQWLPDESPRPLSYRDVAGKAGKCLLKASFTSGKAFDPVAIKDLPSGKYRLTVTAKDSLGKEAKYEQNFVVFSMNDTKPPVDALEWFYVPSNEFAPGKDATVLFGSAGKDVYVFYDVFSGNKRLTSKHFMLTDSIVRMVYPYKQEYGNGISIRFAFVKDNVLYDKTISIIKEEPDKRLEMKWSVFRDKLVPGQKEEWKLDIRYPDGKPAEAELLATMYDASLDQLLKYTWNFGLRFNRSTPSTSYFGGYLQTNYLAFAFGWKSLGVKSLLFDRLTTDNFSLPDRMYGVMPVMRRNLFASSTGNVHTKMAVEAGMRLADMEESAANSILLDQAVVEDTTNPVALRTDFAETAFFYPQLRTNAKGEVSFSFTLPESLTEWKFMGLSHTKNMDWAEMTAEAVARKEFMVSPNMPRFVRIGDHTTIASSIINLTDKNISGTVRMELFNPVDDKVFFVQKQKFAVPAGKTEAVTFSFDVKDNMSVMACRIVADGGSFSDGEQRYIPVLTDKEWITESIPMTVVGEETKTYSLKSLFNKGSKTATDRRLTVEFTGNPAWYAVQALPSLSNPANDNAVSWASAYYANNIASYIVKSNPRIKTVFDTWRAQGGTKETLWSNLQKNQDLKNILLDESPWLAEATNEAEQKQRLALLFDLNRQQNENTVAIDKLRNIQLPEGAWAWYKGMPGSRYITQYVVEALARMQIMIGEALKEDALAMYDRAFDYLNGCALKEYKSMREAEKKGAKGLLPSELTVHYLYICMLTDAKLPAANQQANTYFIDKLAGSTRMQTIYGKALSAIILQKAGRIAAARDFIASLQEYAVETKDMGMYYDTDKASYSYSAYRIPTQVAVIEAMEQVAKNMKAVEELKIWLLMQKRTQAWDSPLATANAIYALLNRGTNLLDNRDNVKLVLGNKVLETGTSSATTVPGLGYLKETWVGKEITPAMNTITVEKKDPGVAWGAVYAQYLEDMDKVTQQGGPLSVSKKLYVEKMIDGHMQLELLTDASRVQVGDKIIVRLIIRTDQDMDFVQLKDERGACLEPVAALSGYRWQNGLGYYIALKDASSDFFIEQLRKGTYTLESTYYVSRIGEYATGIATIQSAYAPEYSAHTGSIRLNVIEK